MSRDGLKNISNIFLPDERMKMFSVVDTGTKDRRAIEVKDLHDEISQFSLSDNVPDSISTSFDVARNLYVYSWFEYRFTNVSEAKVLTTLEYALKERVGLAEFKKYATDRRTKYHQETGKKLSISYGLKGLIEYCRDNELVRNDRFTQWHRMPMILARQKYKLEKIREMTAQGMDEVELDFSSLELPDLPNDYDHIQHLVGHVNKVRNEYAHGSVMLHNNVLYSFEMVSEFINQIYDK